MWKGKTPRKFNCVFLLRVGDGTIKDATHSCGIRNIHYMRRRSPDAGVAIAAITLVESKIRLPLTNAVNAKANEQLPRFNLTLLMFGTAGRALIHWA